MISIKRCQLIGETCPDLPFTHRLKTLSPLRDSHDLTFNNFWESKFQVILSLSCYTGDFLRIHSIFNTLSENMIQFLSAVHEPMADRSLPFQNPRVSVFKILH